ncbi:hypothetical protein E4U53_006897 [Claviceps sorghi]|nr:hypothetical protein E4U53_006897 [Claviceps sorghi]
MKKQGAALNWTHEIHDATGGTEILAYAKLSQRRAEAAYTAAERAERGLADCLMERAGDDEEKNGSAPEARTDAITVAVAEAAVCVVVVMPWARASGFGQMADGGWRWPQASAGKQSSVPVQLQLQVAG